MTHKELCIKTAKRFNDKCALYEYKSFASQEEPDVLVFGFNGTTLYEIKMSRADFLADAKKQCRRKYKIQTRLDFERQDINPEIKRGYFRAKQWFGELFLKQEPHLGNFRYFVCEYGLIMPDEIPEGWGLYWHKGGKFYHRKSSLKFRSNLKTENHLLIHAIRRHGSGDDTGILINTYSELEKEVT